MAIGPFSEIVEVLVSANGEPGNSVVVFVGHGEISVSITVEVGHQNGAGIFSNRVRRAGGFLKGAVTVSEQNSYIVGSGVGDDQIGRERGNPGGSGKSVAEGSGRNSRWSRLGAG